MKIIFGVFFVALCALFILLNILGAMNEDRKVRGGINNTDTFSQNFCYVTKMDKKSIIERLSIHSGYDKLEYTLGVEPFDYSEYLKIKDAEK